MVKKHRKHKSTKKRCRTALEIEEEQSRTLYIRLPKTIKDAEEVKSLFVGDFQIKLPRQSTRHCHVIFPNIEEKMKNLKLAKQKMIDGKPIFAAPPKPINLNKPKKQKKIKIPDPSKEPNVSKYLFISNLPLGTKASEVKDAFPGSITVVLLKGIVEGTRQARLKMSSSHVSLHYSKTKSEWPKFKGKRCKVALSEAKKKPQKKKSKTLKIYDGENGVKNDKKPSDKKEEKTSEDKETNESENSDEEQSDVEEVESEDQSEEEGEEEEEEEEEENENKEQEDEESEEESSE